MSKHLRVLRSAGLVAARVDAQRRLYRVRSEPLREIDRWLAPALLEFTWGEDTIRFEVTPAGAGCTLTLLDTIAERGKAARDGAGWHVCLDRLEHELDGTRPEWTPAERWRTVHGGYVERFGPAAATIGPPQGSGVT